MFCIYQLRLWLNALSHEITLDQVIPDVEKMLNYFSKDALKASSTFSFRINKGPTEGYEKDVGSKTTHRIVYPESAMDLDNSTHLVLLPVKILDMQWLISAFTTKNITQ